MRREERCFLTPRHLTGDPEDTEVHLGKRSPGAQALEGTPLPVLEWAWGRRRQRGRGGSWGWSHRALLAIVRAVASRTREVGAVGGGGLGRGRSQG